MNDARKDWHGRVTQNCLQTLLVETLKTTRTLHCWRGLPVNHVLSLAHTTLLWQEVLQCHQQSIQYICFIIN